MKHETEHARMSLEGALIDAEQYRPELPTIEEIRNLLLPTVEQIRALLGYQQ